MKFKLPKSLKNIFVKQDKDNEVENKPKKILDIDIIDKIVSEISVIRQLKEGSLKYDKNKDKYTNAKGRKVKKQDVFKPTFVEKPNISSTTAGIFQKTKEMAPAGLGLFGLLLLLTSPEARSFIGNFLKEVLIGKDGLLPEPVKKFVGWFIGGDEKENPVKQSEKAADQFVRIESETDKQQKELSKVEKDVETGAAKLEKEKKKVDDIIDDKKDKKDEKPSEDNEEPKKQTPTPKTEQQSPQTAPPPASPTSSTQPAASQPSATTPTPATQTQEPPKQKRRGSLRAPAEQTATPTPTQTQKPTAAGTTQTAQQATQAAPAASGQQFLKSMSDRAAQAVANFKAIGVTSLPAIEGILKAAAKESGIDPAKPESGADAWKNTVMKTNMTYAKGTSHEKQGLTGYQYMREVFPQLKSMDGGKYLNDQALLEAVNKGNEFFFDMAYGIGNPRQTLGNTQAGDGWKYRGRGYIQITGRNWYTKIANAIGVDIVNNPDLVASDPLVAAKAAIAYLALSFGKQNYAKGLEAINAFTDSTRALQFITLNVASGGAGLNEQLLAKKLQDANFQQQLSKAEEKGGQVAKQALGTPASSGVAATPPPSTGTQVAQQSADVGSAKKQQDADKKVSTNTVLSKTSTTTAVPCKDAKGGFGECTKAA